MVAVKEAVIEVAEVRSCASCGHDEATTIKSISESAGLSVT